MPAVRPFHRAMQGWISEKFATVLFLLCAGFLVFVTGALVVVSDSFPSGHIKDAYRAGIALYEKRTRRHDPLSTDLWKEARTSARGTTLVDHERAHSGLTLYTSGHEARALLIDMDGNALHEWHQPFSALWDETAAARHPVPDRQVYMRKAHVYPNGDLLAIYEGVGDSPYGYGMVKLDRDSRVLWKNLDHFHHSFEVAEGGRIYALTHAFRNDLPKTRSGWVVDHFPPPFSDDYLVVMSPDGEVLTKISLIDAVNQSDFRRLLWRVPSYSMEDPLHANDVDVLNGERAAWLRAKVPVAREGQVLLSLRELATGTVALLDLEREEIVWALQGQWLSQHDPVVLPNGNILMFDNRGHFGAGGQSRLIEVDPASGGVVWSYAGTEDMPLESLIRAEQQVLPNGNFLVTESDGGRLLEITRDGRPVWEFINPVRAGEQSELIPVVCWGQRIEPQSLDADFRDAVTSRMVADTTGSTQADETTSR